jgi:hypothetical protein
MSQVLTFKRHGAWPATLGPIKSEAVVRRVDEGYVEFGGW